MEYAGIIKRTGNIYTMKAFTKQGKQVFTAFSIEGLFNQLKKVRQA